MNRIRVLEIISGFAVEGPLGGIERFGIELAQALDRTLIEPIVCGMWAYGTPYEYNWVSLLNQQGVNAFIAADWDEKSPYKSFKNAYWGTKNQIKTPVDIIHSHCQFGDILALLLKRQLGAKVLIRTVHNEREWGKRPLRRFFLTNAIYPIYFDVEIGVAQQVVNNLDNRLLARLHRKLTIKGYNAINTQRFNKKNEIIKQNKRKCLNLPLSGQIVGTIGRLTKQKGYALFLNSAKLILDELPDTYFIIVGTGELEQELKKQAKDLGLTQRVIFLGARNDVEELLYAFDVFVNSSFWEGLPTVIMESMLAKVPVVATSVGGNEELIDHKKTGILVPPKDPQRLAKAVIEILKMDPEILKNITTKAQLFILNNFSISTVAQQHNKLYKKMFENINKINS